MEIISKRGIIKNSGYLYLRMIIVMIISFFISRLMLLNLGEINFGVYGVVWSTITLFSFFNLALTTSSRRVLSFELGNKNNNYPQVFGNIIAYCIIVGLMFYSILLILGTYLIKTKLNLPFDKVDSSFSAYKILSIVFFVTILQIPFSSSLLAQEKIKTYSVLNILDVVFRLIAVMLLSVVKYDLLISFSVFLLFANLIVLFLYIIKGSDNFKIKFKLDKKTIRTLNKYIFWNSLGGISSVAVSQGVQLLINSFFPVTVNAAQTIALQVRNSIESFSANVKVAFNSPIIKSCASDDNKEVVDLLSLSIRFSSISVLIISVPLITKLDYILKLWLVNPPKYSYILCLLYLINSIIDNVSSPMVSVIQAKGNIRSYQILNSMIFILILPITYIFYKNGREPEVYGYIFILSSILILFVRIHNIKNILGTETRRITKLLLFQIIIAPIITLSIPLLISYYTEDTIISLVGILILSFIIVITVSWFAIMNNLERKFVINYVKYKWRKR